MNKNTARGLAILAVLIIVAVLLWRHYLTGPAAVGPAAPVTTSKPAVAPPPAAPEPKPPVPQAPPAAVPSKPESPQGLAPLQEPTTPESKITLPPPQKMEEHFGILVGTYRRYRDAAKMLARLKRQGKPAFVQRDPRDMTRFQVWLGPFASQDKARAAEKEMRALLKKPLKIEQIENPVPK
jgi:cell division septation protein DedD